MASSVACAAILDGTTANEIKSTFDGGNGDIYLVDGLDCWVAIQDGITNSILQAQQGVAALEALHFPTDVILEELDQFALGDDYSEGGIAYISWQWDQSELISGDYVGTCIYQNSGAAAENHATCFSLKYNGNGSYSSPLDYLVKPSTIGVNSDLEDYASIDSSVPLGTNGTWIVSGIQTAFDSTVRVSAARMIPKVNSTQDPAILKGATEVVTYISKRSATATNAAEALMSVDHIALKQTNNFTGNAKWQSEQVTLACYNEASCADAPAPGEGSAVTVTSVGAAIVALAAMLTF